MITSIKPSGGNLPLKLLSGLLIGGLLLVSTGCSTTRQLKKDKESGFLDGNYSLLRPGKKGEANYIYIAPDVDWAKYKEVYIKPIELWHSEDPDSPLGKLSRENQEMLVSYAHHALAENLGLHFKLVDKPGPDVLVIHAAVTEAKKSRPVIDLVTSVYMPLRVLSFAKRLATGSDIAVGKVHAEIEITDGETGKIVAEGVDARVGTKALRSKFGGYWGDVKLAFDWWGQRIVTRLALLQAGEDQTQKPEKM